MSFAIPASRFYRTAIVKTDVKDFKIMKELTADCRVPLSQVAKHAMLSRDAVDYRIKRMKDKKIVTLFYPRINYKRLGYYVYHVFLLIDEMTKGSQEKLFTSLRNHPHILSVIEYSDKWDLEIALLARNIDEFDDVLMGLVNSFPELILEKDKLEMIKHYVSRKVPLSLIENEAVVKEQSVEPIVLDEKDKKILALLSEDARRSTYEIGKAVKLSSDAIIYRIRKLKEEGVIVEFTSLINLSALGMNWYTCGIQFKKFDKTNEAKLKEFVRGHNHILRAVKTLGVWDLLLYISTSEAEDYHQTIKQIKKEFGDIIRNYDIWIAYQEHYFNPFPKVLEN